MTRGDDPLSAARRVDWRFLLEDPEPSRVALVGPPEESLRRALATFGAEPTCWHDPPSEAAGSFDLVVVTSPRAQHAREAARLVADGGTLRWESRGAPRTPSARAALQQCGFEDVRVHWHRPRFEEALEAIPLEAGNVLDHVLQGGAHGPAGELRRAGARALRAAGLLDLIASCRGVSGRRGPARPAGLPARLQDAAAQRAGGRSEDVALLLRTPRFRASGHVLLFAFPAGASAPTLAAKIARQPGPSASLSREASTLELLAEKASSVPGVPRLVERTTAGRFHAIVETIVPGKVLHPARVRRAPGVALECFVGWVEELHRRTRVYAITSGWWEEAVEQPLQRIEAFFGSGSREAKLAARTREIAAALRDVATSWVLEHGDLSAPNLLLDGDRPGVVDWELGTNHGIPGGDLFFLLGFLASAQAGSTSASAARGALHRAFFGKDPWAAPWVRRYAKIVGIPSEELRTLYVLAWARSVASTLERLVGDGETGAGAPAGDVRSWLRRERCWTAWHDALEHFDELDPDGSGRRGA